jgi:hypothetical protein
MPPNKPIQGNHIFSGMARKCFKVAANGFMFEMILPALLQKWFRGIAPADLQKKKTKVKKTVPFLF